MFENAKLNGPFSSSRSHTFHISSGQLFIDKNMLSVKRFTPRKLKCISKNIFHQNETKDMLFKCQCV